VDRYGKDSEGWSSNTELQKRSKGEPKDAQKKNKRARIIQDMVLRSITCESESSFTIIFSDVKF
jgi:hypothetical protein